MPQPRTQLAILELAGQVEVVVAPLQGLQIDQAVVQGTGGTRAGEITVPPPSLHIKAAG